MRDWARRFAPALDDLSDALAEWRRTRSDSYQLGRFVEALARGYAGDPFGAAIEEGARQEAIDGRLDEAWRRYDRLWAEFAGMARELSGEAAAGANG